MKYLIKIILLCTVLFSSVFANTQKINEYKSDLYFANGIMGETAAKTREVWEEETRNILSNIPESSKTIGKIDIAYNASQGFFDDIFEAFEQQISNEWGWSDFSEYFRMHLELKGIQEEVDKHSPDLTVQVNAYKESIKSGHSVIVIAHSQGNYYANEAYEELDEWMKPYFHMMGVATPANHVAGGGPHVTFHNDIINLVVSGLDSNRHNPNTQHDPILSYDAHDFYNSYMTAGNTKNEIQSFILGKIEAHKEADSQWKVEEELRKDTEDYK